MENIDFFAAVDELNAEIPQKKVTRRAPAQGFRPFRVTAFLAGGYASYDPWSPTLDGPMAYFHFLERLGPDRFFNTPEGKTHRVDDADLPLARRYSGSKGDFFFAVSSPFPDPPMSETMRYYHKRFDTAHADRHVEIGRKRTVQTKTGPYKSHRVPLRIVICPSVSWYAFGDPAATLELCERIRFIGKRHAHGHGQILRWSVEEQAEDWSVIRDGQLMRPVPVKLGLEGQLPPGTYVHTDHGIRPPYHHSSKQRPCLVPLSAQALAFQQ